jgi:hypothetical protein
MMRPVFNWSWCWSVLALLASFGSAAAAPAAGAGSVQGVVVVPSQVEAPPSESLGFLTPIENRVANPRQYDPLPEIFILLEPEAGTTLPPELTKAPAAPVVWNLVSSFAVPVLPVTRGSTVKVVNNGRETHLLFSTDAPELLPRDPLGPATSRDILLGDRAEPLAVRSRSVPHVAGVIVPLGSRLFTRVDRAGRFKLEGVPAGRWLVKVYYRSGWLSLPKSFPFEVGAKAVELKVELPDPLKPAGK